MTICGSEGEKGKDKNNFCLTVCHFLRACVSGGGKGGREGEGVGGWGGHGKSRLSSAVLGKTPSWPKWEKHRAQSYRESVLISS